MIYLEELLPQLDVGIRDGSDEPALDFKLNGVALLPSPICTQQVIWHNPVYKFIDRFIRPLLDILQFIDTDSWGSLI